ncbi:MAG: hypothetical protein EOO17_05475 [Chloroflexi bacterium]|nr:MAG: hypothetical protein EOO17_05475 [Chloroflexota bacterium]
MARLPQPGGDAGNWGQILNDFLLQTLKTDGTVKDNVITGAALAPNSVTATTIANGTISEAQLNGAVQSKLNAAGNGTIADGSVAKVKLAASVQTSLDRADSALQSVVNGSITEAKLDSAAQTKLNAASNAVLLTTNQTIAGDKTFSGILRSTAIRAEGVNSIQVSGGEYPSIAITNGSNVIRSQIVADPASGSTSVDYTASAGGSFYVRNNPQDGTAMLTINTIGSTFANKIIAPSLQITGASPAVGKVLTSDASGNATWQTPAASGGVEFSGDKVKLKTLYQPIVGVFPSSELVQDQYVHDNIDANNYTSLTGTIWNSPRLNTQSQKLVAVDPGNVAAGCTNMSNGRTIGSCFDIEFELTGDKFAIHMQTFGYFDTQIYVEHEGQMMKLKTYPMGEDYAGTNFRSIRFARYATRRIRIVMPFIYFFQILHESNAIIKRTPDRPMIAITGDSYVDGSSAYNAGSARSYAVAGTVDAIIEATGFAVLRLGQGGTGYFNNATGVASDTPGPVNSTRFFSTSRIAAMSAFGASKIVALVVNGTINDGELSGGTAGMRVRALAGFQAVNGFDPGISIISVSPEPLNNAQAGNVHDLNRLGLIQAIDEHPQGVGFIDFFNPTDPLWTGTGTEANPLNDPQSKLVGGDAIHGNWAGYKLYGQHIAMQMAEMKIPIERAWL